MYFIHEGLMEKVLFVGRTAEWNLHHGRTSLLDINALQTQCELTDFMILQLQCEH